jgi:hypothetical protein
MVRVTSRMILEAGLHLLGGGAALCRSVSLSSQIKLFNSCFGSHPLVYSKIWGDLRALDPEHLDMKNFLITIYWLRHYDTETGLEVRFNLSDTTVRKWCKYYTKLIFKLAGTKVC